MKSDPPKNRDKNPDSTKSNLNNQVFDNAENDKPAVNKWLSDEIEKCKKHIKNCKLKFNQTDMTRLTDFIKLEATFNKQYKTEDFYSCIENKNFLFTEGVPDDWESHTLWNKDEKMMMDVIQDENYKRCNVNVKSTYQAWKNMSSHNFKFPTTDSITAAYIKQEIIGKMIPPPPGFKTEHEQSTKVLEFHESFFDFIEFVPSVPGPGKIRNDPTNGDMHSPVSNMKSFRYQIDDEWLDVMVFLPENILKVEKSNTPVIVHMGSGVGDYFHYYNGNRGREKYFTNEKLKWYNEHCIIISLDYYVPHDKNWKFYTNPNESLVKNVLDQISSRFTNKDLRFLSGHSRGAQSAFFAHVNNPDFTNRVYMTELTISDNPSTRFDEKIAKYLMKYMPPGSSVIAVNGDKNYYRSENFEVFTAKHENFDLKLVEGYGTTCHQQGILEIFKPEIEHALKQCTMMEKTQMQ